MASNILSITSLLSSKQKTYLLSSKQKTFLNILMLVSITLTLFVLSVKPKRVHIITITNIFQVDKRKPAWFDVIEKSIDSSQRIIKVGLVNINPRVDGSLYEQLDALYPKVEKVSVDFDHVDENLKWKDLFPTWIDEDEKWGHPKCKDLPMPTWESYRDVNVVMARVPCGINGIEMEGVRDVFRLQVNLVVANLAVESGWVMKLSAYEPVFVVFIGSCGPMVDIFRCDDLLLHYKSCEGDEYWVYKPDLWSLRQKMLMPVGSCQLAPGYAETGKEMWRSYRLLKYNYTMRIPKLAYVTVLHSSEAYVCGAIALAQSIIGTEQSISPYKNYTRDLLLLADESISPKSIKGLKSAGWKIKRIRRILNPFAQKGTYNEWNYSKLRIWQLTMYDKIIFLDSDLLVLKNIDDFFDYPQLSAAPNDFTLFNSGLMVIEPSKCMFEELMSKTLNLKLKPYTGGDQGFLNEIFTWWHRLPTKVVNYTKSFQGSDYEENEIIPKDLYAIQYLGLKPWMCYRDHDCNWDMKELHVFASDLANKMWWKVYNRMPKELQVYCGLTQKMDERIIERRRRARNVNLSDGHWKIEAKDPRRKHYQDSN